MNRAGWLKLLVVFITLSFNFKSFPMEKMMQFLNSVYPMTEELMADLASIVKFRTLREREYLLQEGEICRELHFIQSGYLRIFYLKDGKEVSTWFLGETETIVSVDSFYDQVPSYEFIQAIEPCELYYINYDELEATYEKHMVFNFIGRVLTIRYMRMLSRQLRSIRMLSGLERYQQLLQKDPELLRRAPLKYLASYLDMEPETLSRMRGKII